MYLENGARQRYTYNGSLTGNRMAYEIAATAVTLNDLGHLQAAGLFKRNPLNFCAAFYTISTDLVLTQSLR